MGLSEILKRIEEKSKREAQEILDAARRQAEERIAAARSQAEALVKEKRDEALNRALLLETTARGRGQTKARHIVQKAKGELIDEVLEQALKALREMPDADYREFLIQLVVSQARGDEELVLDEADRARLGPDFPRLVAEKVRERTGGRPLEVRFEPASLGGGFVLRAPGIEVDSTFPALLRTMRDSLELFLASHLFGVDDDGRV